MLRGAISGFGEVAARAHLIGWRTRPDVQIVAIHDPAPARRHAALNLIKHIRVYDDLELMLDGERLDFVDIASPPAYHAPTAARALEAGAHVLIEKPLCLAPQVLAGLQSAASHAARVLMCVHNWKHAPAYRRAHDLIRAGRLGEITHIALDRLRTGAAGPGAAGAGERWRLDARAGGGILIDHGWHIFYLLQWLMGGQPPVAVAAALEVQPGTNVDDVARLRLTFPAATADVHLSWRAATRATTARIAGTAATLAIDGNRLDLRMPDGRHEDCSVADSADDSYHPTWFAGMAADFVRALEQGPEGAVMAENGAEVASAVALLTAARQSANAGGARIELDRPAASGRARS